MTFTLFAVFLYATSIFDSTELSDNDKIWYEKKLNAGIEAFYQTDWNRSSKIFSDIKERHTNDPTPYFFESMKPFLKYFFVEQSKELANEFLEKSEKAIVLSQKRLEETQTDTTMVLMLSGLFGYRGLVAAGEGEHRIALQSGLKGFNYTRQLLSINSNRPDARIGKGMFYYMVGSVPSGMKWATHLFGIRAEIDDGFKELKIAAESESYISNDAKMMLMYLYQKENRLQDALVYANELTETLPKNVIFLYEKARILQNLGENSAALRIFERIIDMNNPNLTLITEKSRKKVAELKKTALNSR